MKKYDCIVVGGGLAGLTSAAYLGKAGISTLLVEKREKLGGLVETFWHKGFAFDAGIRAFENSGIVFPMLKELGIQMDFVKNEVSIGIGEESMELKSKESLLDYEAMLLRLFPESGGEIRTIMAEIEKVMEYMDVLYGIDNPLFMEKMDLEYLSKTILPWFLRYQVNIRKAGRLNEPIRKHLLKMTGNTALVDMIIQHFFKDTPAFFALSYFTLYLDYCYPLGGTGMLAEKMVEFIREKKGDILTGTGALKVDAKRKILTLENGETVGYGKLIWAADQRSLYERVEGVSERSFENRMKLVEESSGGDSILTVFLGVDLEKAYFKERCGAHMFFTPSTQGLSTVSVPGDVEESSAEDCYRFTEEYLRKTTYEISCPPVRDASLAPEGQTGLVISTLMDYSLVKRMRDLGQYEAWKDFAAQTSMEVLEETLLPNLRASTLFSLCATPLTMEKETHNFQGAITGWAFTNPVMPSENRFKKIMKAIQTPIPDLYQCGQWTFSPSGLPVSILTGKLAADAVKKDLKKQNQRI